MQLVDKADNQATNPSLLKAVHNIPQVREGDDNLFLRVNVSFLIFTGLGAGRREEGGEVRREGRGRGRSRKEGGGGGERRRGRRGGTGRSKGGGGAGR